MSCALSSNLEVKGKKLPSSTRKNSGLLFGGFGVGGGGGILPWLGQRKKIVDRENNNGGGRNIEKKKKVESDYRE